jgi:tetratricopeptide (TPR) repeat protein
MQPSASATQLCLRASATVGLLAAACLCWFASADVSSLDAGELGGAAASLGVPHPSGFPLDMLLLRAATLVPLGPLAFRQNVCVSLIAAVAIGCNVFLCLRLSRQCGWLSAPAAAAAASVSGAALISSRILLDSALSVEVYATSLACVLAAWLLVDAAVSRALWPLLGLSLGAHITAPLLIVPAAGLVIRRSRRGLWLAGIGALILCYLPLAALRDSAFDWGDPSTWERFVRHMSAARIREAYTAALFSSDSEPRLHLLQQLTEQPHWLALALLGAVALFQKQRARALGLGALLCLDLAYASWINPMGVAQRQVGHASSAVIALLAGCGSAAIVDRVRLQLRAAAPRLAALAAGACLWAVSHALYAYASSDGYAVPERYAAGSPLQELPPRALFLCESDTACASALFGVYAEGTRPDLDVVPAQHLWEPTVWRRLRWLSLPAAHDWPEPSLRAGIAAQRQRTLLEQTSRRPVYAELAGCGMDLRRAPLIGCSAELQYERAALTRLERARFGAAGPETELARELWASAHQTLGSVLLGSDRAGDAVAELSRAVALTPLRASAHSNLGVALEQSGDLAAALTETAQAVELDPQRPTPWVNLTRLLLRLHGPDAALAALHDASEYAVRDPRLDELALQLQGTTRK